MEIYFDVNEWKLVGGLVEGWGIFVIFGYYRKLLSGLDCRLRFIVLILLIFFIFCELFLLFFLIIKVFRLKKIYVYLICFIIVLLNIINVFDFIVCIYIYLVM